MRLAALALVAMLAGAGPGVCDPLPTNKIACLALSDWTDLGIPTGLPTINLEQKQSAGRCFQLYKGQEMFRGPQVRLEDDRNVEIGFSCMTSATIQKGKCLYVFDGPVN